MSADLPPLVSGPSILSVAVTPLPVTSNGESVLYRQVSRFYTRSTLDLVLLVSLLLHLSPLNQKKGVFFLSYHTLFPLTPFHLLVPFLLGLEPMHSGFSTGGVQWLAPAVLEAKLFEGPMIFICC